MAAYTGDDPIHSDGRSRTIFPGPPLQFGQFAVGQGEEKRATYRDDYKKYYLRMGSSARARASPLSPGSSSQRNIAHAKCEEEERISRMCGCWQCHANLWRAFMRRLNFSRILSLALTTQ